MFMKVVSNCYFFFLAYCSKNWLNYEKFWLMQIMCSCWLELHFFYFNLRAWLWGGSGVTTHQTTLLPFSVHRLKTPPNTSHPLLPPKVLQCADTLPIQVTNSNNYLTFLDTPSLLMQNAKTHSQQRKCIDLIIFCCYPLILMQNQKKTSLNVFQPSL